MLLLQATVLWSGVSFSGGRDFVRRLVAEAAVGPVVVAVDVGGHLLAGLVEGLELLAPDAAEFEL